MNALSLVWFRDDLRVADNPALWAAAQHNAPIVAVFIHDERSPGVRPLGSATHWWLQESLKHLRSRLEERHIPLVIRSGITEHTVSTIVDELGATAVFWNRRYSAAERSIDAAVKNTLRARGVHAESFCASLLYEPWTVRTGSDTAYRVFTPFWNACLRLPQPRTPVPSETVRNQSTPALPGETTVTEIALHPPEEWTQKLHAHWAPGETSATQHLHSFLDSAVADYPDTHEYPARSGTSGLSAALRWGEISPYQVWHAAHEQLTPQTATAVHAFLRQLAWREFAWHVLFHFPDLATKNWNSTFDRMRWPAHDPETLTAWQRGKTGIALVDAGMKELWQTGTMHNRVRMVVASFLTKNLRIHWHYGEQWFWDTLVDADAAANPFNWQWAAGSGADAAPYFRIFNPVTQAQRYDPGGEYIARWAPEYSARSTENAPPPLVDLGASRAAALEAYKVMRNGT